MCSKIELLAVLLDSQATWTKRDLRFLSLTACQELFRVFLEAANASNHYQKLDFAAHRG
ncbi:MAG: hypothetical protein ACLT98_04305 [Eggerthellaceae bacterium]